MPRVPAKFPRSRATRSGGALYLDSTGHEQEASKSGVDHRRHRWPGAQRRGKPGHSNRDAVKAHRPKGPNGTNGKSVNDVADADYLAIDLCSFASGQDLLLSGGADR